MLAIIAIIAGYMSFAFATSVFLSVHKCPLESAVCLGVLWPSTLFLLACYEIGRLWVHGIRATAAALERRAEAKRLPAAVAKEVGR